MMMKKFINDPDNLVNEVLNGFALANADKVKLAGNNLVVRANPKSEDKVALVTLGGSGHEPALSGYVGEGMLDISVPGEIFAAPGPPRVLEALRMANRPAGVLLVVPGQRHQYRYHRVVRKFGIGEQGLTQQRACLP